MVHSAISSVVVQKLATICILFRNIAMHKRQISLIVIYIRYDVLYANI